MWFCTFDIILLNDPCKNHILVVLCVFFPVKNGNAKVLHSSWNICNHSMNNKALGDVLYPFRMLDRALAH